MKIVSICLGLVMLILEYRYHHISNAGTAFPNEPINSSKILLGISWLH